MKRWLPALAWLMFVGVIIYLADRHLARWFFRFLDGHPGSDKVGHFCLIGGTAFFVNLALRGREFRFLGRGWLLGSLLVGVAFTIEEFTQLRIPWRTFDYGDLTADFVGILFFGWVARRVLGRQRQKEQILDAEKPHVA